MHFTIHCTFAPGAFADAKRLRLEHYAFLREVQNLIVEGGPLLGPDGNPSGMLMVVEMADEHAVRAFIAGEPYTANGYFESVAVRRWAHVIPEPQPGYIESEYQKELSTRSDQHNAS
jgi:uncharacterized protein YciI